MCVEQKRSEKKSQARREKSREAEKWARRCSQKTITGKKLQSPAIKARDGRAAFKRAGYLCEQVGPTGIRCTAKVNLQKDHKVAYGLGGAHELENFQILCAAHNLRKAEREFGREFIANKIAERRNGSALQVEQKMHEPSDIGVLLN